ncbi:MAG: hypothetical protein PHO42_00880 [Candidatus Omnitrophica bacterium]|nr:hypothetical protein [Candidatus Omnitrophota bacterium]
MKIAMILLLVCTVTTFAMPAWSQEAAAPTAPQAAPTGTKTEETDIVAGKVTAVDAANNTLTVADEAGKTYTLLATKEETSIWKGDNTIELPDLKVDDSIELEYYKNKDDKMVAIWIDVLTQEPAPAPQEAQPEPPKTE